MRGEPFTGTLQKPRSRAAEKKQALRDEDANWRKVRAEVMLRDRYRCRACGLPASDVHHIKFRSAGGEDTTANCVVMCREDHAEMHAYRLFVVGDNANGKLKFQRVK